MIENKLWKNILKLKTLDCDTHIIFSLLAVTADAAMAVLPSRPEGLVVDATTPVVNKCFAIKIASNILHRVQTLWGKSHLVYHYSMCFKLEYL